VACRFYVKILSAAVFSLMASAAFAGQAAVSPAQSGAAHTVTAAMDASAQIQPDDAQAAAAQTLPPIKQTGNVYSFTLANGMQVVVLPNSRAPIVTNMVWYKVGSADEPRGRTGIAHFLEHLMFKGTPAHPGDEFTSYVAKIGGEQNAFTSYDFTGYYETVATKYLGDMMAREADRMENLTLTDAVVTPERQVIIEERRMRTDNSPAAMLAEETRATLFQNSPYHNPVIGWKQEMEQLSRQDALDFYGKYYTPNNAIAIIAGDVKPEDARALAMKTYGLLKVRAQVPPRIRPQEPVSHTLRMVTMRDPRVSEPSFQDFRIVPSYHNAKIKGEAEALDLLSEILGGGSQSRLYKDLIVRQGIAADVGAGYDGAAVDDGTFYVYGVPRGGASLDKLRQAVTAEIQNIIKNGVTQAELDAARKRYLRDFIFSKDSPSGYAQLYGMSLATGMTIEDVNSWPDRLKAVTPADIKAVAARYLTLGLGVVSELLPPEGAAQAKTAGKNAAMQEPVSHGIGGQTVQ